MRKFAKVILLLLLTFASFALFQPRVSAQNEVVIHFFYWSQCEHCHEERLVLDGLEAKYDNLTVYHYEYYETGTKDLMKEIFDTFQAAPYDYGTSTYSPTAVPVTVIGGYAFWGYNSSRDAEIEKMINLYSSVDYVDIVQKLMDGEPVLDADFDQLTLEEGDIITLPILGEVPIESLSIGLAAMVIGIIDGFNPCAMWILLLLITLLVNGKDRKRMWILGSAFLFTSALVYFFAMMAWLNVASLVTEVSWIRILLGILAMIFGIFSLRKLMIENKKIDIGCDTTSVRDRKKKTEKVKAAILEKNIFVAVMGIVFLAASVNVVELACSAGLPLLFSQILAYNGLTFSTAFGYVLVYIFFFLLDDMIVFSAAMITMRVSGLSNKYSRFSRFAGGILMILIGFLLIFFPGIVMFNF